MKCADCKYWSGEYEWEGPIKVKRCFKAIQYWDASEWGKDENGLDDYISRIELDSSQMMYVQDGSDYHASLLTKADFFCAHFEEKAND